MQLELAAPQARTCHLLDLHTELRRVLFGRSAVLMRLKCGCPPSSITVDVVKLLQLWDYEQSLNPQVSTDDQGWAPSQAHSHMALCSTLLQARHEG